MRHPAGLPDAGWVPSSPCGSHCLPPAPRARGWRPILRATALILVLVAAVGTVPVLAVARARTGWLRRVAGLLLAAMGVAVLVRGPRRLDAGGALVVANHVSWVEILALASWQPVRLVAKREVRDWPVIGAIAAALGVLFIDRQGLRELPGTVAAMSATLRSGGLVAVFPEGTTWCGAAAGRFRPAPFQAALDAGVSVRPVGVALRRGGRAAPEAAYVGGQPLIRSVRRVLGLSGLVCELTVLPAIPAAGDRGELARRAAAAVTSATGVAHPVRPRRAAEARPAAASPAA